jgi:hypothetical protein
MPREVHLHPHSANVHRAAAVNPIGTDAPGAKSTVAPYRPDCTPTGAVGHPKGGFQPMRDPRRFLLVRMRSRRTCMRGGGDCVAALQSLVSLQVFW